MTRVHPIYGGLGVKSDRKEFEVGLGHKGQGILNYVTAILY